MSRWVCQFLVKIIIFFIKLLFYNILTLISESILTKFLCLVQKNSNLYFSLMLPFISHPVKVKKKNTHTCPSLNTKKIVYLSK